jgi:hypothetical protein
VLPIVAVDASDATAASVASSADASLDLTPLDDDAGDADIDANEAGRFWTANQFTQRIEACCALIANRAAQLPNGPQQFQLRSAASGCYAFATNVANEKALLAARSLAAQVKVNCP